MTFLLFGAGLFLLPLLFRLALRLRLGIPLLYALLALTVFHGWYQAHTALADCQRQFEIVRKRRRNFVVFRRGGGNKNQVLPCSKRVFTICCFWRINSLRSFRR